MKAKSGKKIAEISKDIEIEVMEVHNLFWDSYARRDIDLRFSLCSEEVTFIGSGLHERALNKAEYKNINREGVKQFPNPFQIEFLWTNLTMLNENVACVESEVVWSQLINNEMSKELLRNTTLLKREYNKWLVTHVHGSVPDYRLKAGDYMTNEQTIIRNRELERQVFERTQDLNKTLEELEQKNRELEIETALEKVRSSALAMKEPADMVNVCNVISDQLQLLGVKDIRNVQTAIINEQKVTYFNYQYFAAYKEGAIEETDFNKHPTVFAMVEEMKKSANSTFSGIMKDKELITFREWRKQNNQFPDPILDEVDSAYYYFYSIGLGGLGLTTYKPLPEEGLDIFKRFHNVFTLAYRRFIDIEKAIAQAKEAMIEASLEKVRAAAMSMNKPEDLLNICEVLFKEFLKLGFGELRNAMINIHNDEKGTFINYDYSDVIGRSINHLTYNIHPVIEKQIKQIRSANDAFSETSFTGKDLEEWKKFRNKIGEKDDQRIDEISALYYYFYSIGTGSIGISTFSSINVEKLELLKRFRNVFSLSYQRYLDIALAESQAREAQIELALERVRARTMAMQKSDELKEVVASMFDGMMSLGVDPTVCNIALVDRKTCDTDVWTAHLTDNGMITYKVFISHFEHPFRKKLLDSFLNEIPFSVHELSGDLKKSYVQYLFEHVDYSSVPTEITKSNEELANMEDGIVLSAAYMKYGLLIVSRNHAISNDESDILQRFAKIFQQTYTRFLDLQKAEAQAKEAKIEAALEKIRARALAMRNSSEVGNVSTLLFLELEKMNVNPSGFSIMIFDEVRDKYELWRAKEVTHQGAYETFSIKAMYDKFDKYVPGFSEELKTAWSKGNPFFIGEFRGENRDSFLQANREMASYSDEAFEEMKKDWPDPTFWHLVFFKYGWVGVLQNKQLIKEELLLIHRFAEVFDFAYTRFLDLQKAEAQAREAQIEAALERVRSRTMGMQKSVELKDVIRVVYEQFVHLKINVDHAGFVVDYTPKGDWHFWIADEQDIPSKITHPYFESVWANQFNEAKEKGIDFFATNLNFEEKNKFYNELLSYVPGLPEASKVFYLRCPGLAATTILFDNVSLYIENFSGTPYSDEDNKILMRFGKVFQQTYTRFLDLQKAEAQAREGQIQLALERVRARTMAMQHSDELQNAAKLLFQQIKLMGIETGSCGFNIWNKDEKTATVWVSSPEGGLQEPFSMPHTVSNLYREVYRAKEDEQNYFVKELSGKVLQNHFDYLLTLPGIGIIIKGLRETGYHFPEKIIFHFAFFAQGYLSFHLHNTNSEAAEIFQRFAIVFEQTYTRFLDLQKAEAQAREAQIEASLERVRSKALAMHSPNDLSETVSVFFKELRSLNMLPWRCGVGQINEETKTTFLTTTSNTINGESFEVRGTLQQEGHFVLDGIFEHWKMQKEYYPVLQGDDIRNYYEIIKPQIAYPVYPLDAIQYGHFIFIKEGFVFAWTENKLSEEELGIFRRFASVLSLTYRRYLDLKEAEKQNKIIQADNERKTKELEEARQLQLSMLPKELPKLPNLQLAAFMRTATEVGGDYYDFIVQENGTLNVGFGDATGHGLQAGTMITLMKGLFTSDSSKLGPKEFMSHCTRVIKDIKLGRILMSFSYLKIDDHKIQMTSAGMPPIYYHSKKNNRTEEIIIQGMPLGAMLNSSYNIIEKKLNSGDTILLLTDGLPEQLNSKHVMFDYSRIQKYFSEIAEYPPEEIINSLVKKADDWRGGTPQTDDITFVVIKVT